MAKAIAVIAHGDAWRTVYLDRHDPSCRVGWATESRTYSCRRAWLRGADEPIMSVVADAPSGRTPEEDVRWILEQIPGCADLEIEWVNE